MSMSHQPPLRRSTRVAAMLDAKQIEENAKKMKTRGRGVVVAAKNKGPTNPPASTTSTKTTTTTTTTTTLVKRPTSRSRSPRTKSKLISLSSLSEPTVPLRRSPRLSNSNERNCPTNNHHESIIGPVTKSVDMIPTSTTTTSCTPRSKHYHATNRSCVVTPATFQSSKHIPPPPHERSLLSSYSSSVSKGVTFNLSRNSFAEYLDEHPPNAVVHLIREFDDSDENDTDDDSTSTVTRKTRSSSNVTERKGNGSFVEDTLSSSSSSNGGCKRRGRRMTMISSSHSRTRSHIEIDDEEEDDDDDDEVTRTNESILASWDYHFDT